MLLDVNQPGILGGGKWNKAWMNSIRTYRNKELVKRKLTVIGAKLDIIFPGTRYCHFYICLHCLTDNGGKVPTYSLQAHPRKVP